MKSIIRIKNKWNQPLLKQSTNSLIETLLLPTVNVIKTNDCAI